ncbi:unnamed protein product [Parascedosporium putredinis]|uniref:Uncharacterized protein n=1 Tax=Parascedosporium putredinis TaxID=1442378 RepID=A0A9P1H1K9_9PEZI|nr:unnamed protein product [Parascedosporium putredinis]CAI7993890.1 unnamed protein product [Parascedosporium putredinis]
MAASLAVPGESIRLTPRDGNKCRVTKLFDVHAPDLFDLAISEREVALQILEGLRFDRNDVDPVVKAAEITTKIIKPKDQSQPTSSLAHDPNRSILNDAMSYIKNRHFGDEVSKEEKRCYERIIDTQMVRSMALICYLSGDSQNRIDIKDIFFAGIRAMNTLAELIELLKSGDVSHSGISSKGVECQATMVIDAARKRGDYLRQLIEGLCMFWDLVTSTSFIRLIIEMQLTKP